MKKLIPHESNLDESNPAIAAGYIILFFKLLYGLIVIGELITAFAPVIKQMERGGRFDEADLLSVFGMLFIVIPLTLVLYYVTTRLAIAPLMSWHFGRENLIATRELLAEIKAQRTQAPIETAPTETLPQEQ